VDETVVRECEAAEHAAVTDLYRVAPSALRERFGLECVERPGVLTLLAPGLPVPMFNRALILDGALAAADLEASLASLANGRRRAYVQVPPGAEFDAVRTELQARFGAPAGSWARFRRAERRVADAVTAFELRELGESDAPAFGSTIAVGFGLPPELTPWLERLVGRKGWRAFGAFDSGRLVGCGATFLEGARRTAWVGFGAVEPSSRRRGAQQAILVRRMRAAFADGAAAVVSETGKPKPGEDGPSFRNLSRTLGFAYLRENYLVKAH
jgi:hypothetical protein